MCIRTRLIPLREQSPLARSAVSGLASRAPRFRPGIRLDKLDKAVGIQF